jgi:hypothetical protein
VNEQIEQAVRAALNRQVEYVLDNSFKAESAADVLKAFRESVELELKRFERVQS